MNPSVVFGNSEVPLQQDVLPLGISHDPFPIATELRIVRRQQHQTGQDPSAEIVDEVTIKRAVELEEAKA